MLKVSLIMIAKNEEKYLPRCLGSLEGLFDEIVIVDTGSTDRTKEVAKDFGAKVVDFEWIDDFSAARNFGLKHATGDWIFWLDADEYFDAENKKKFKKILENLKPNTAYLMSRVFLQKSLEISKGLILRLFPKYPDAHWQYRVHEKITDSIMKHKPKIEQTDIVNFISREDEKLISKHEYYLKLLQEELKEKPQNTYLLFNLIDEYFVFEQYDKVIEIADQCIQLMQRDDALLEYVLIYLAKALYFTGKITDALSVIRNGLNIYPNNFQLMFFGATIHHFQGNNEKAKEILQQIIESSYKLNKDASPPAATRRILAENFLNEIGAT